MVHNSVYSKYEKKKIQNKEGRKPSRPISTSSSSDQQKIFNQDERIVNFVVNGLHAFSIVEEEGFKELFPGVKIMSRGIFKNKNLLNMFETKM